MTWSAVFGAAFYDEVDEQAAHLETAAGRLTAQQFLDAVDRTLRDIIESPEDYRFDEDCAAHRLRARPFRNMIWYRIDGTQVNILALTHTSMSEATILRLLS
jgi:plasmid stabilization system protein ParE